MASSLSMVFDLLAVDRASAVFQKVGDSAGEAGAKVEAASATTSNAGSKIAAGLGVAAAAAAVYSVKMAADFQTNVTKLATTAGEAQGNLKKVSDGMLAMAGQVGVGAVELAKGMYTIESSGIHGADALTALKAAAQGAKQENADLAHVADALSTVLHDYNLPASAAADTTSKLVEAVAHGKTTFDELTASLHSVTPLAAALHVPLQDILGSLSAMTASGMSADQATQNMADALRHLQSPTAGMTSELAQLGITSADLSAQLGTKGLAGVMQEISDAIVQRLDPATQKVLLPALNQSKTAAQDMQTMIGQMPKALADLSTSLLNGQTSLGDYQKAAKSMGGDAGAMGLQFLSLYKSADGFNQLLKSGSPAAQEYSAALYKAVGDSSSLSVALQLTGEHAATTNKAISDVAKASGDASGNIKGWSEVQGNFNQQMAEAGAKLQAIAIEAGQHLLPALTEFMHFVNGTALPGLQSLGSVVLDAAHWWSQLPQPIKDVTVALAALRIADMIGVFDKLGSVVGTVTTAFKSFRDEMALQQTLLSMEQAAGNAEASFGRLGATGSVAMGKLKSAGSSLVDMFGGPWVVALGGSVLAIKALNDAFVNDYDPAAALAVKDAQNLTSAQQNYTAALEASKGAIDSNVRASAAKSLQDAGVLAAANSAGVSLSEVTDAVLHQGTAYDDVKQKLQTYYSVMLINSGDGTEASRKQAQAALDAYNAFLKLGGQLPEEAAKQQQLSQAIYGTANTVDGLKNALTQMGITSQVTWNNNTATINGATAAQIQDLKNLGLAVKTLPDGSITVTADTSPASAAINGLLAAYQHVSYTGSAIVVNGRVVANADGNLLPMSATQASVVSPGTLRVIGDNPVADEAFIPINGSSRSMSILGQTASRMGYGLVPMAAGGVLSMSDKFWAEPSQAMLDSAKALVSFAGGSSSGGNAANRALGQSIANAMGVGGQFSAIDYVFTRESGWNNNAQNPTSTAYGIPQFLASTWAQYGGKTSDPATQIRDGILYMENRYGSPNGAAAFWQGHHWYKDGTNYVPSDQLAVLHKGEAVVPASKNQGAPFQGGGPVQITGTLRIDGDGLAHIVDGRIADTLTATHDRAAY